MPPDTDEKWPKNPAATDFFDLDPGYHLANDVAFHVFNNFGPYGIAGLKSA